MKKKKRRESGVLNRNSSKLRTAGRERELKYIAEYISTPIPPLTTPSFIMKPLSGRTSL
jgi:hypothetical protein